MELLYWQDVMIYLAGGENPVCGDSTKEAIPWIAKRLGKAVSTTYGYYEGRGEPSVSEARNLHEDLVTHFKCHVVMKYLNHEFNSKKGSSNGRVQDDFWAIHELSTDGSRYFKEALNDSVEAKQKYFDVVQQIKVEVKDLEAEGENL